METISAFDVIGPVMIGPSSSHTAGALRIASLARKILRGAVRKVEFTLYGSFADTYKGHGTDRALVGGMLGFDAGDGRIRDSFEWADHEGLEYCFTVDRTDMNIHPNAVDIRMTAADGHTVKVTGVSTGGGAAEIRSIDGVEVVITGEYASILVKQRDEPGVVAHISKCLAEAGVNIAFMRLYREGRGRIAYTIVETDQYIDEKAVKAIEDYPSVVEVIPIE